MKKIFIIGALCLSIASLTACSSNNTKTPTESKQEKKETKITVDSIITEFKKRWSPSRKSNRPSAKRIW